LRTPFRWWSSRPVAVERGYDIFSLLLKNRIVFLGTPIDDVVANLLDAQLRYLAQDDPERELQMYINSPGGQIDAGLAIYDTMHLMQPQVATTCVGMAASMGAVLLGWWPERQAVGSAQLAHLDPPGFGRLPGHPSDIEVQAGEIIRMSTRLQEMMAADTGQTVERVAHDINREYWISAAEAMEYGVVDLSARQPRRRRPIGPRRPSRRRAKASASHSAVNPDFAA
jgi:ATP-dependent Clp protease protease subunit